MWCVAAEVGEPLAHAAQVLLGLGELLAGEADRVLARLLGERVHQRARLSARIALGDGLGVLGREGVGAHVDDAGGALEADLDHPLPVREQRLDRGVVAEGEDRVALGAGCRCVRRSSSASIASTMLWLRMYSKRMSASEAVPEPIWVIAPSSPAAAEPTSSERIEKATLEWYWSAARV